MWLVPNDDSSLFGNELKSSVANAFFVVWTIPAWGWVISVPSTYEREMVVYMLDKFLACTWPMNKKTANPPTDALSKSLL